MNEEVQDPRHWDWERLRREAEAPLTPAELEQKRNNRKLAKFDASIQKLAMGPRPREPDGTLKSIKLE